MAKPKRKAKQRPQFEVVIDGPTEAQRANGDFERIDMIHADTAQRVTVHINRGGDAIARWERTGKLSDSQMRAIAHCRRLWHLVGLKQRVTANYGERIHGSAEIAMLGRCDAQEDLARIVYYFRFPMDKWYSVFENVCRFDQPAGVAGAELGYSSRANEERANTIVRFVADIIATNERL